MKRLGLAILAYICLISAVLGWGLSSPPVTAPQYQIAATNGVYPWFKNDQTASNRRQVISRFPIAIGCESSSLRLAFDNSYINANGGITQQAQPLTSVQVYLEQPSPALSVAITGLGSGTFTIPQAANAFLTDPILPSAFGQATFAKDSQWWLRITAVVANPTIWGLGNYAASTGANVFLYDPANNVVQVGNTGALTQPSGSATPNFALGPTAILGVPISPTTCKSTIGTGASYMVGTNDNGNGSITGTGQLARASLSGANNNVVSDVIPFTAFKLGGQGAQQALTWTPLQTYFQYAHIYYNDLVNNDINPNVNNLGVYQAYSYVTQLWQRSRGLGSNVKSIVQMRLNPSSDSTDNWATTAGQTIATTRGPGGVADQLNRLFDVAVSQGQITAQYRLDALRVSTDTTTINYWKWCNNEVTPQYCTEEGGHPTSINSNTYASSSTELRSVLQSVPVN